MPSNTRWVLYAPSPEEGLPSPDVPAWLLELYNSQERLGEESEFVLLSEVESGQWTCGLLEGYVSLSSVVGAFFSAHEGHVLVLLQKGSPECVPQPSLVQGACKGAFQVPLPKVPVNRSELVALFNDAYLYLLRRGLVQ
jgi:hypothetical protein